MLEQILERFDDEEILIADGFDAAVIGVCEDFNSPPRLAYSVKKCLEILVADFWVDSEEENVEVEAMEYFTYNVSGAYVGEGTPVWVWDLDY